MESPVVRFRVITMDEIEFRRGEVMKVALHPILLLCYAASTLLVILIDSKGTRETLDGWSHVISYVIACTTAIAFIIASLRLAEARARPGTIVTVNGSLSCFCGAMLGLFAGETIPLAVLGHGTISFVEGLILSLFYYGLTELVMVFLTAYVLPVVQARVRGKATPAAVQAVDADREQERPAQPANLPAMPAGGVVAVLPKRPADVLRVGSARFMISDLRRIEAEGNYVRIVTAGARHLLPGPFSQVIQQLPAGAGQVTSRSRWVAAGAIVAHRRQGRDLYLLLDDGSESKVAASRRDSVTAWLRSIEQARTLQVG